MKNMIQTFAKSESGAITVDWVVLTSTIVGLGMAVVIIVNGGIESLSTEIGQEMSDTDVSINPFDRN